MTDDTTGNQPENQEQKKESVQKIINFQNVELSAKQQEELNAPEKDMTGVDVQDTAFLNDVVSKIEKKSIDLYKPSSLLNNEVYDKLSGENQAKADMDAFNMLSTIREIHNLWKLGHRESYQIQYLVRKIRLTKERLEEVGGDIFII
jgi:hypothetical protein